MSDDEEENDRDEVQDFYDLQQEDDYVEENEALPDHLANLIFEGDDDHAEHLENLINSVVVDAKLTNTNTEAYIEHLFGIEQLGEDLSDRFDSTGWVPPSQGKLKTLLFPYILYIFFYRIFT